MVVRVRPLNNSERFANESNVLQFPGNGGIVATNQDKELVIKNFTFNVVFEPEATQKDVFEHCGIEEVVDLALAGYSTTCICYGQTGSGKTHTLSGPPNLVSPFPKVGSSKLYQLCNLQFCPYFARVCKNSEKIFKKIFYLQISSIPR